MDHTFSLKNNQGVVSHYWGSDHIENEESALFEALDYCNDLIDKFKQYYEASYGNEIPRPHLFVIERSAVNAFAVWEESLNEYCIGIFQGAIQIIEEKVKEIVDMVIDRSSNVPEEDQLIPKEERDIWIKHVFIDAMRFFVAHEYAHILCGHVDLQEKSYMEFMDDMLTEEENMYQQMKEFDADETAMRILCYMNRSSWESGYRRGTYEINESMRKRNEALKEMGIPERLINKTSEGFIQQVRLEHEKKVEGIRLYFKHIMLGANVVFLTLDERRSDKMDCLADKLNIPQEDRTKFYFTSGLQLIRNVDHPIPAIRLDAVIRIMDEYIEDIESKSDADKVCDEVAQYVWEVEYLHRDGELNKLYILIAYTPTAQDFIREIDALWQTKKNEFKPYIGQLVRLFYVNRIVNMTDDGELVVVRDSKGI